MASPLRGDFNVPSQQSSPDDLAGPELPPLAAAVAKLESITVALRQLQFALPLATLLSLMLLLLGYLHVTPAFYFYFAVFADAFAVLFVTFYEIAVKRGNVLFEEISDELQWHIETEGILRPINPKEATPKGPVAPERPAINVRVVLRSFAQATDLPLFPGRYGPAFYTLINLVLIFLAAWQMNDFIHR